jgi:hypothetical protein
MRHSATLGAVVTCAALLAACSGGNGSADRNTADQSAANNPLLNRDSRPEPVTATGCLTESGGRFVVTALDKSPAVPTTTTYQLSGGDDSNLQAQVNREVRVAGEAQPAQVADVRNAPTPAVGTTGTNRDQDVAPGSEPTVKTQESMRFVVRDLKVSSVTPTGNPCASGSSAPSPDR